ncbi:MAG: ATP-binding protein [Clostridia bacterium]|nr:ATP-binding protein [Clostridia bacterium]
MDILQNSIAAYATRISTEIRVDEGMDEMVIVVSDNGIGMDPEFLAVVTDPFMTSRETRKVGLGISLFKASSERAEGTLTIESIKGEGTRLAASFKVSHIDRLPLGDIAQTIVATILSKPEIDLELLFCNKRDQFRLELGEIREKLGEVLITEYAVLNWIKDFINDGIKSIFGGVLNEIHS